jgi:hypothetical protein
MTTPLPPAAATTISWTKLEPLADPVHGIPCTRSSHGVSMIRNGTRLIVHGGEHVARTPLDTETQATWAADCVTPDGGEACWQWRRIITPTAAPPLRVAHAQAAFQDTMVFVFGGRAGVAMEEQPMNDLWMLDASGEPGTETWTLIESLGGSAPPSPRSFHRMVCVGTHLYVFGGCGETGRLADLFKFDCVHKTWESLGSSALLKGRGGANLIPLSSGTTLAVVAGFAGEETADGHCFDIAQGSWRDTALTDQLEGLRPRSVCVSGSFPSVGVAVIFGGEVDPSERGHEGAGGFENDVVLLDESTGKYISSTSVAEGSDSSAWPETRGWSDAAAVDMGDGAGALFVFGGLSGDDDSPRRLDDLWRLDVRRS